MIGRLKQFGCLLTTSVLLVALGNMFYSSYAQQSHEVLFWSAGTSKSAFYPGEPLLFVVNIKNLGAQDEKVNLGAQGIGAFSIEIRDSNGIIVREGNKIERFGFTDRPSVIEVPAGAVVQKAIVLNRWCSTLLPPGQYYVICNVEYRLRSESRKKKDSEIFQAGPVHKKQLGVDIRVIEMDGDKFKEMLETLFALEVKPEAQSKAEWLAKRDIAREMLSFAESELAVAYQLQLLRNDPYTWLMPDIINSLVRCGTLEAANGLMHLIEEPSISRDVHPIIIDGVFRLRETGRSEIVIATDEFVRKNKRPLLTSPID